MVSPMRTMRVPSRRASPPTAVPRSRVPADNNATERLAHRRSKDQDDGQDPTFKFSSNDATAKFSCIVDGQPPTACTSPFTTRKLKKGKHTFAVIATDAAGNASLPASQTFTVKKKQKRR